MSIPWLLSSLSERGVTLRVEDGQLRYRGPAGALTEDDKAALRTRREDLVAYLHARAAAPRPMHPPPEPGTLVASPNQIVWWNLCHGLAQQLRMEKVPFVLPLTSATAAEAEAAIRALVKAHRVMCSRFSAGPDGPTVALNSADDLVVEIKSVADPGELPAVLAAFVAQPNPVDGPWLTKAWVLDVTDGPTVIALLFHHMTFDGTSLGLIAEDLKGALSGKGVEAQGIGFTDYAAWERGWFVSGAARPLTDYWRDWLGRTPRLTAPSGTDLRWVPGARIDHPLALPAALSPAIAKAAAEARSSPFVVILAVFARALAQWSGQERFALRCIGDLRATQDLGRTVGLLICADALEAEVPKGGDFIDLVRRIAAEYESALALRLPTHPSGTGAGYTEFHEEIAATINYVPTGVLRSTAPKPGESESAREAPWPAPPNKAQRVEWPAPLPSIYLRLWEGDDGLAGRLECNEATLTPEEQADLVAAVMAAFGDIL